MDARAKTPRRKGLRVILGARLGARKTTLRVPQPRTAGGFSYRELALGFIILITASTLLLMLPVSSAERQVTPLIDALFTATSAVTTTGLIVVDTGGHYSLFGELIILILFQIGGLGYMIFIVLIVIGLGGRLSLRTKMLLQGSISQPTAADTRTFIKLIVLFAFSVETIGAVLFSVYWMEYFPTPEAIYLGIFHAVSAFNTAGFSLFLDSLSSYRGSLGLNLLVNAVTIAGGIGFFVVYDVYVLGRKALRGQRPRTMSTHSKFVLLLSAIFMLGGTAFIFFSEVARQPLPAGERLLVSAFQSISASTTTGFNTVDIGAMSPAGLLTLIVLMFVGASPGGTGGGIKTSTVGVMALFLYSFLAGREEVNLLRRRIPSGTISKAFAVGLIAVLWMLSVLLVLTISEQAPFLDLLFETVSAIGTVGLSTGITANLSVLGKALVSATMLVGRLGLLAVALSLVGRHKPATFKYAEDDVLVG